MAVLRGAERLLAQRRVMAVLCEVGFSRNDEVHTNPWTCRPDEGSGLYSGWVLRHRRLPADARDRGSIFANALFVRRDVVGR